MYSRKPSVKYNTSDAQRKIESFNNELREQYRQKNSVIKETSSSVVKTQSNNEKSPSVLDKATQLLQYDEIIIIGLIILLLIEEKTDYLLIGVLAALLFLSR